MGSRTLIVLVGLVLAVTGVVVQGKVAPVGSSGGLVPPNEVEHGNIIEEEITTAILTNTTQADKNNDTTREEVGGGGGGGGDYSSLLTKCLSLPDFDNLTALRAALNEVKAMSIHLEQIVRNHPLNSEPGIEQKNVTTTTNTTQQPPVVEVVTTVIATPKTGYGCERRLPFEKRVDCHPEPGVTTAECHRRGCVWCADVPHTARVPWCFFLKDVEGNTFPPVELANQSILELATAYGCDMLNVPFERRVDCHPEPNASPQSCHRRGCVWCADNDPARGVPWCFFSNATDELRTQQTTPQGPTTERRSSTTESSSNTKGGEGYGCEERLPFLQRVDCHPEPAATEGECWRRGCVWCADVAHTERIPWCFFRNNVMEEETDSTQTPAWTSLPIKAETRETSPQPVQSGVGYGCERRLPFDARVDCHPEPAATEQVCRGRGCFWCADVAHTAGVPWCFFPTTTTTKDAKAATETPDENSEETATTRTASVPEAESAISGLVLEEEGGYGCEKRLPFDSRVDCHPEPAATERECRRRGCVWCADVAHTRGMPWCFFLNGRRDDLPDDIK